MTIQERAALVLQQIDAALALAEKEPSYEYDGQSLKLGNRRQMLRPDGEGTINQTNAAFIAASRTLLPASLCCLKMAIEGLQRICRCTPTGDSGRTVAEQSLTTLCDQWEAKP